MSIELSAKERDIVRAAAQGSIAWLNGADSAEKGSNPDVLATLERAVAILSAKAPAHLIGYRNTLLVACAQASSGPTGTDQAVRDAIAQIRRALSGGGSVESGVPGQ